MKTFYTIIGLIGIFFFSIPIHLFAATEYNPDAIEVDTLPECNQQVVNNVYAYNNHYWKCNLIPGELRNIQVGDVLLDKTIYFTFPETDDFYNSILSGNVISFANVYYTYEGSNKKSSLAIKINYFNNLKTLEFNYSALVSPIYIYKEKQKQIDSLTLSLPLENIYNASFEVLSVDTTNPVYQYIKVAASESMYEYEDQGEIPSLYTYEDKDFYLFYDFGMIANLDIFSNYDFTSFTDYQKVVVVIGFNVFYIAILCFFGAIIYKTLARIIRFILG